MGSVLTTTAQIDEKLRQAATAMEQAELLAVKAISQLVKDEGTRQLRRATGGDLVLSGTGRSTIGRDSKARKSKEKKLSIGYNVRPGARGPSSLLGVRGPMPLVENDQDRHIVTSRFARAANFQTTVLTGKNAGKTRKARNTIDSRTATVLFGGQLGGDRRAVLNFGNGTYRRWTTAKSKGRRPWQKTLDEIRPKVAGVLASEERKALLRVFEA